MGLVLPISSMAALLAILPKIASCASITCHCRIMPSLEGNSVLIDTRLQLFLELQNIKLTEIRGSLSNRVTGLHRAADHPSIRLRVQRGAETRRKRGRTNNLEVGSYPCGRFFACSMAIWLMCDREA